MDRDELGRRVREVWIAWAMEQPAVKLSWITPYDALDEPDKEVDRRIGETLYNAGVAAQRDEIARLRGLLTMAGDWSDACWRENANDFDVASKSGIFRENLVRYRRSQANSQEASYLETES